MKTTTKISKTTLDILKNFSNINEKIYIEPGNKLYTLSPATNIIAEAYVEEQFDGKICIYELNKFLGVISLFDSPEFEFDEKSVTIHGSNSSKVRFFFCDEEVILKYVKNHGKLPKQQKNMYSFDITQKQIDEISRASSVLGLKTIKISRAETGVDFSLFDKDNTTANEYSINIRDAEVDDDAEDAYMRISLLGILPGNYRVDVDDGKLTKWTNKNIDLKYFIAKDILED